MRTSRATRDVAIALGSNVGDRRANLDHAVSRLRSLLEDVRVSAYHLTAPVGVPGEQRHFLNAAVVGRASTPPADILERLLEIEAERGRVRHFPGAARTLDLDLILCGELVVRTPTLTLPHPRFRERPFVLLPLAEVAPDLVDPVTTLTVRELLGRVSGRT